ncbi:putative protein 43 [Haloarcula hispanica icosahedral virus 2]|uniref:Uncharacterized protein n=1 Tax=Haloarcula hispanica icosahedral virus 2 TaxID=1154689 RepID=H9AZZ9_9VIRU|nr:putative protein 43 [Haloarcula hispanica icosahedral virus 2]AFD02324.1 putative protein 43 [Haloarcula hispanica icosahedral virus 2]
MARSHTLTGTDEPTDEHDCLDHVEDHDDPALPDHVKVAECAVCGRWFEHDTEADTYEVDA